MLLALLYSVFRLLLDVLIDRRRSDASLRLELLLSAALSRDEAAAALDESL